MKKSKKLLLSTICLSSTVLVVTPVVTACSDAMKDLKIVERGNGDVFAKFKFNGEDQTITFNDALARSITTKDGFAAFKTQVAKELIYNWYKGVVDSGDKAPQSFKDNWNTWTDEAEDAYDDKMQSYKDSHKKTWKYYFQNEVLDPVGGTKDAFIRQQMYDKVYESFKELVFTTNYLSYTTDATPTVNSNISTFTEQDFEEPSKWANIDFYAKANSSYREGTQDLDDVYALIQREAFNEYTSAKHPQALLMALWKYAAPTDSAAMYSIYSAKIPASDEEPESVNLGEDPEPEPEPTKTLTAKYATPAFPLWNGGEYTANQKFTELVNDFWVAPRMQNIDNNGMFRYENKGSIYQDDGSTMGFVLNMNEMYSTLDAWFAPAVSNLYAQCYNQFQSDPDNKIKVEDHFLEYPVEDLLTSGQEGYVDIMSNFLFRSNDKRLYGETADATLLENLKALDNDGYVLDVGDHFEFKGTHEDLQTSTGNSNFHSELFLNSPTATYDYFGVDDDEGGVQWAVNALWLTKGGERLPYILFRDTNGVHLCGLYGAWAYDENGDIKKGFLADNKYDETKFGQPWSQGRQNIMLKALNLFMKYRNESLFDISSEVKTYFTSNVDDIVIKMAIDKVNRKGEAQSTDPIFKLSDVLGGVTEDSFKKILSDSTVFFLLQNTLATYEEANKKIFNLESAYVTNSLLSRSNNTTLKNKTSDNYKNALATIAPYDVVYSNINPETDLYKAKITYDVTTLCNWISVTESESGEYSELQKLNEDVFIESTGVDTEVMTQQIESGIKNLDDEWNNIIENVLDIHSATKPNSEYGKWSEHLNPEYKYNKDKASDAVQNGLYMALNKYLEGTEISNGIKIDASKAYATKGDNSIVKKDAEGDPEIDEYGIATLDDTDTKYPGLTDAVASLHNTSKVFTSETPLSYYTNATTTMTQSKYTEMVNNLANQSIIANTSSNVASDDLATYWNFLDTIQYLVSDNYAKLMEYLQTSVMSYGVEADLVWLVQDDRNANPTFIQETGQGTSVSDLFGWQENYMGKYSSTYLNPKGDNTPSTYVDNGVYYQTAPMKYDDGNATQTLDLAMGFAGLVTPSNAPSAITSTLQGALFTDTYLSKTDANKSVHYGGWNKYVSYDELVKYIGTLTSIGDIQKIATGLGAANKDADFTRNVVDVVNKTTFQDSDPEVKASGSQWKSGDAITPEVAKGRLLGGTKTYGNVTVNYDEVGWGLTKYNTDKPTDVTNLFKKFGADGVAKQLYDINSNGHAMRSTSEATTAGQYARLMVVQLNNSDFRASQDHPAFENLCYALSGSYTDTTMLNYLAVQYAALSSLQTQATNDVVKQILGKDNKVTVYDRRLNDKLGQTWVKDYKTTN